MGNNTHRLATLFCMLPVLNGCTGTAFVSSSETVSVTSEPPGAMAYVMGEPVGETPLSIKQKDLFPAVYDQSKQDLYGTILFKKTGCEDLSQPVGMNAGGTGINAKLVCEGQPLTQEKAVQAAPVEEPKAPNVETQRQTSKQTVAKQPSHSVKQRLINLQDLRDSGLVSEEEYLNIRQRILDEL